MPVVLVLAILKYFAMWISIKNNKKKNYMGLTHLTIS